MNLRGMYMHIVHGRNKQFIAKVDNLCLLTFQLGQICRNARHLTVLHSNVTIFKYLETILLFRKKDVCLINLFHTEFNDLH